MSVPINFQRLLAHGAVNGEQQEVFTMSKPDIYKVTYKHYRGGAGGTGHFISRPTDLLESPIVADCVRLSTGPFTRFWLERTFNIDLEWLVIQQENMHCRVIGFSNQ